MVPLFENFSDVLLCGFISFSKSEIYQATGDVVSDNRLMAPSYSQGGVSIQAFFTEYFSIF